MAEPQYLALMSLDDMPDNSSHAVTLAGEPVLLCRSNGEVFAIQNRCSHADEPLACGIVRLGWIACPAHGARFDLETGEPLGPPATAPIRTYPTRIVDGRIEVAI